MRFNQNRLLGTLLLALAPFASATTWYVNGVTGSDGNNCQSPQTACKSINHAMSLASSGDSIIVAAAIYKTNLEIVKSLTILGSGAPTTIIDGGRRGTVVAISRGTHTHATISKMTIQGGYVPVGGGINNGGTLTINQCTVSGNTAFHTEFGGGAGGGIANEGTLLINESTINGNSVDEDGGGITNLGTLTINNSTLSGNSALGATGGLGGGIFNAGTLTISNGTVSGNSATSGGGIYNTATSTLQNTIVANSSSGGNCSGTVTSNGYNLSSDGSCNFNGPGDLNNTDPMLGPLQNNGGPTPTMALPSRSPAIDAGNPAGCVDWLGQLLKTDQRGAPRPDKEDTGGCDIGAYERQSD